MELDGHRDLGGEAHGAVGMDAAAEVAVSVKFQPIGAITP